MSSMCSDIILFLLSSLTSTAGDVLHYHSPVLFINHCLVWTSHQTEQGRSRLQQTIGFAEINSADLP